MKQGVLEKTTNAVWRFFCSVRLTIVLLIILALASIVGTLIPQQDSAVEFAREFPGMARLFFSLDLFDMYHSLWFRLLIGFLALNLISCSIHRFPRTWKRFSASPRPDRKKPFEAIPPHQTFLVPGNMGDLEGRLEKTFKSRFKNVQKKESEEGGIFYYGDRGRFSHFGFYLVHLSILLIIIGAVIGSIAGFEATVGILEGGQIQTVQKKDRTHMHLGFEVRCDKFIAEFYENGTPKEYRSDLTFIVNGREVKKTSTRVNHPAKFRGITFYQSSYGTTAGKKVTLVLSQNGKDPKVNTIVAELEKPVHLPGKEGQFAVTEVHENFKGMMGPAVQISLKPGNGEEIRFFIFQNFEMLKKRFPPEMLKAPILNPSAFAPYTFALDDIESRHYTGLQVNKDPGVTLVWIGCFLMIAGFFATFFSSHRRLWLRVLKEKKGVGISVAGTSNKNPVGLEREIDQLTKTLKNVLSEKRE